MATPYILYFISSLFALKGKQKKENKVIYIYINMWTLRAASRIVAPHHGKNTAPRPLSAYPLQIFTQSHNKTHNITLINQQHTKQ